MSSLPFRLAVVATAASSLALARSAHAAVVFVNAAQAAPLASQDGTSWATAYQDLRTALVASPTGSEFWIATGTYRPTTTTDRTISFVVKANQKLLGGFLPGATSASDRDPGTHPTILSGDIGVPGLATDNTEHVVASVNAPGVRLDGLIIEDGWNDTVGTAGNGAGLRITNGDQLLITGCVIRRCTNGNRGAGAHLLGCDNATIRHTTFVGNAGGIGGALEAQNAPFLLANCRFLGNTATFASGAISAIATVGSLIVNCEFSGNSTQSVGGGDGGAITIANGMAVRSSTFVGNSSLDEGGAIALTLGASPVDITNCIFADNAAASGQHIQFSTTAVPVTFCGFSDAPASGVGNAVIEPGFRDPLGADGIRGTIDDDLTLTGGSEAIDRGNGAMIPADTADLDGDGNTAEATPIDAGEKPRLVDDLRPDEGAAPNPFLDLGAHEFERPTRVYFVDADVDEDGNGSSWEKAFAKVQSAIAAAQGEPQPKPVEIWVAEGVYTPGPERTDSFMPQGSIAILGGFKGEEWRRSDRRPVEYATVLSGEIGDPDSTDDNTLHVVHFAGDAVYPETVLDGFVITGGNADEGGPLGSIGGGVLVSGVAQPTVRNCRVIGNRAKFGGGGVAVIGTGSRIALTNSYLGGNASANAGGGMLVTGAANGSTVVHCTIAGNEAEFGGGLVAQGSGSSACVLNTILAENLEEQGPSSTSDVALQSGGSLSLAFCAVPCGNTIAFGQDLISLPPAFVSLAGPDDRIGTLDDDFTLLPTSPLIDAGARVATCGAAVPNDSGDLDDDGDLLETIPVDGLGLPRAVDDPSRPNADRILAVDIGAAERQTSSRTDLLPGDLDGNGSVDGADLAIMLGEWGGYDQAIDLNGDCEVDAADLAVLLGGWTG